MLKVHLDEKSVLVLYTPGLVGCGYLDKKQNTTFGNHTNISLFPMTKVYSFYMYSDEHIATCCATSSAHSARGQADDPFRRHPTNSADIKWSADSGHLPTITASAIW